MKASTNSKLEEIRLRLESKIGLPEDIDPESAWLYGRDLNKDEVAALQNAPFYKKHAASDVVGVYDAGHGKFSFLISNAKEHRALAPQIKREFDSWLSQNKSKAEPSDDRTLSALSNWLEIVRSLPAVRRVQYKLMGGGIVLQTDQMYGGKIAATDVEDATGMSVSAFAAWLGKHGAKAVSKVG